MTSTTDVVRLEGIFPVRAALLSGYRQVHVVSIDRDRADRAAMDLRQLAGRQGVRVALVKRAWLDREARSASHGGVIALAGPRALQPLEALADSAPLPFVVMLDGVEDPYNFGQAVRSLYAAGADGLVLRPRNWLSASDLVARASAGATELIPTAVAETAEEAAEVLRRKGLTVACAATEGSVSIFEARLDIPLFLVIGGERRGISRSLLRRADVRLCIPYARRTGYSLGTSAASAIIAAEVMRQRRAHDRSTAAWAGVEALDRHRRCPLRVAASNALAESPSATGPSAWSGAAGSMVWVS
jgi:23S rRNA (guanosine2251-2'-O)-methyltransferase